MFEQASRLKLRFDTPKGSLSVEDLWDLPLSARNGGASLDNVARDLSRKVKDTETESFVVKAPKTDEVTKLKFELVKYIIGVRLTEIEAADLAKAKSEKRQQILSIISRKQNEQLESTPLEELQAMVNSL